MVMVMVMIIGRIGTGGAPQGPVSASHWIKTYSVMQMPCKSMTSCRGKRWLWAPDEGY